VAQRVLLEELVVDRQDSAAGVAEDDFDTLVDQCPKDDRRACQFLRRHGRILTAETVPMCWKGETLKNRPEPVNIYAAWAMAHPRVSIWGKSSNPLAGVGSALWGVVRPREGLTPLSRPHYIGMLKAVRSIGWTG
jgi:hypothetical protein